MQSSSTSSPTPAQGRPVTAKDVALRAGVTRPTVSIVLNGAKSGTVVSDATRKRVLQAAQELGYRPNLAARAMKSGKSRQIGVLVRNNSRVRLQEAMSHPLAYEMVLGISEGLEEAGYMMGFVRLSDVDPDLHTQNSAFQGHLLDGLIVVSDVPAASASRLESLVPHCVWLDSSIWRDENCIRRDEFHAGCQTAQQVLALGYRDWVYLRRSHVSDVQTLPHFSRDLRWRGITEVAQNADVPVDVWELPYGDGEMSSLEGLMGRLRPTTALICDGYYTAYDVSRFLLTSRWRPGYDFALASCEAIGVTSSSGTWKELTGTIFDRFKLGQAGARIMLQLVAPGETLGGDSLEMPSFCASQLQQDPWYAGHTAGMCPPLKTE